MRMTIAIGMTVLLAGCGGVTTTSTTTKTDNGTTAVSTTNAPAGLSGSNNCDKNPDFAPIYAGAAISVCSSAHIEATGRDSGTVSYTTPAAPAAVLAWSKEQATKSGLTQRAADDKMFSAGEGNKRTLMVMALPEGTGSRVTVNWGKQP